MPKDLPQHCCTYGKTRLGTALSRLEILSVDTQRKCTDLKIWPRQRRIPPSTSAQRRMLSPQSGAAADIGRALEVAIAGLKKMTTNCHCSRTFCDQLNLLFISANSPDSYVKTTCGFKLPDWL